MTAAPITLGDHWSQQNYVLKMYEYWIWKIKLCNLAQRSILHFSDPKRLSIEDQRRLWSTREVDPKPPPRTIATITSIRSWKTWTSTRISGILELPIVRQDSCRATTRIPWATVEDTTCIKSTNGRSQRALNMNNPCLVMIWGKLLHFIFMMAARRSAIAFSSLPPWSP